MFLDANAHLPINPKALKTYQDFNSSIAGHGHPSSLSEPGRAAAIALEESREKIAQLIGANHPNQIIFTSNCTQAAEWGTKIFLSNFKGNYILTSPVEHNAIRNALSVYKSFSDRIENLRINAQGVIDPTINYGLLLPANKVICTHLQNEIGNIYPLQNFKLQIDSKCQYLFSDMSQSLGKIPVNVTDLEVDIAIFGAHKFGGLSVGWMYLKNTEDYQEFGTGSRYFFDRPGTPDVAGIVASTAALEDCISTLPQRTENMMAFQNKLESELINRGVEVIGINTNRSPNTTFIFVPGKAIHLLLELGKLGIHVGLGSACGSMHSGTSPTIDALGRTGNNQDYIRISQFGDYNEKDAEYFITQFDKAL